MLHMCDLPYVLLQGFVSTGSGAPTVEQSLVMLEHLCTEALDSVSLQLFNAQLFYPDLSSPLHPPPSSPPLPSTSSSPHPSLQRVILDYIQSSVIKVEEMRRKKRQALKEKTKDCRYM